MHRPLSSADRKSTRLNSSHTVIYTLSLHDALPIFQIVIGKNGRSVSVCRDSLDAPESSIETNAPSTIQCRSEEHTSELQSHRDLHSFPTRRSSDLSDRDREKRAVGFGVPRQSRRP